MGEGHRGGGAPICVGHVSSSPYNSQRHCTHFAPTICFYLIYLDHFVNSLVHIAGDL